MSTFSLVSCGMAVAKEAELNIMFFRFLIVTVRQCETLLRVSA